MSIKIKFNKFITKCQAIGIKTCVKGLLKRCYYIMLQRKFGFDKWHISPLEFRKYAQDISALINFLDLNCVVEVGCGLGEIIRNINAHNRYGYDISESAILCADFLDKRGKVTYRVGSFDGVMEKQIDCLITINFIHNIAPEILKSIYAELLSSKNIDYLLVDSVHSKQYRYNHNFNQILPSDYKLQKTLGPYESERFILLYKKTSGQ